MSCFNTFWEKLYQNPVQFFSVFPRGVPPHSNALQYYVKREKCKVNDVIFSSGCEAGAINLGNKNMKIGIFTGATSVGWKNIFTGISRYPTGKHEINIHHGDVFYLIFLLCPATKERRYIVSLLSISTSFCQSLCLSVYLSVCL